MATMRKRPVKGINEASAAAAGEPGRARTARSEQKASADNPAPARKRRKASPFDEQLIRERAYAIWIAEGRPHGRDVEHWLLACGEIEREAA